MSYPGQEESGFVTKCNIHAGTRVQVRSQILHPYSCSDSVARNPNRDEGYSSSATTCTARDATNTSIDHCFDSQRDTCISLLSHKHARQIGAAAQRRPSCTLSGQKVVRWLVCWSVLDFNSINALDQNAVRCVGLVFGRCSLVFWCVSLGGIRYAGW